MPLPLPEPGLVIHYEFLWSYEHIRGEEWGRKRRPCVVLLVTSESGATQVTVAPITHTEPKNREEGLQIPPKVIRDLGLDDSHPSSLSLMN
jgi:hypothetical protein